jgi:hypothetical protein
VLRLHIKRRGKMKRQNQLLIFIVLPLILSLSVSATNVPAAGPQPAATTAQVAVSPAAVIKDYTALPVGSYFNVNLTVANVTSLGTWQVNMTYDPTKLNWTSTGSSTGNFLKGNPSAQWHGQPFADQTAPYTVLGPQSPGNYTTGGWTNPIYGLSDDKLYATCKVNNTAETYAKYWSSTPSTIAAVIKLEVGIKAYSSNASDHDSIWLQTSNNAGTTWGPVHTITVYGSETTWYEDVTSDFAWTPAMLVTLRVRVTYHQVGAYPATINLNWIPVRVTDQLVVSNSARAWDNDLSSYASFAYSQRSGNFSVRDFGHNFPGGGSTPADETSQILQVDLHMKFGANASASGDQYRILFTSPVLTTNAVILQAYKSTSTALATYDWLNVTNPNAEPWNWGDVSAILFTVQCNKVGGDVNAKFYEYEAWLTVKYLRPTSSASSADYTHGWVLFGESTTGSYAGVTGSGWLGTFKFKVVGYGTSLLNITNSVTVLLDDKAPPNQITRTTANGFFRNKLTGDIDGVKRGSTYTVDKYDFGLFAQAYGSSAGPPPSSNWNQEADFNWDKKVDKYDFGLFAQNYGRTVVAP